MGATEHSEKVESYFAGWEESPNYLDDVEMRRLLRSILGLATTAEGKSLARPHRIGSPLDSLWSLRSGGQGRMAPVPANYTSPLPVGTGTGRNSRALLCYCIASWLSPISAHAQRLHAKSAKSRVVSRAVQ